MEEVIPEDIREFIAQYIDSIAEWEGLLQMRLNPAMQWDAYMLAQTLYITQTLATAMLERLTALGFLGVSAGQPVRYHYEPLRQDMDALISRSAEAYKKYLIPMTHLIHSQNKSRVQEFADAFKLRKD